MPKSASCLVNRARLLAFADVAFAGAQRVTLHRDDGGAVEAGLGQACDSSLRHVVVANTLRALDDVVVVSVENLTRDQVLAMYKTL